MQNPRLFHMDVHCVISDSTGLNPRVLQTPACKDYLKVNCGYQELYPEYKSLSRTTSIRKLGMS